MTKDLALLVYGKEMKREHYLNTQEYILEIRRRLEAKLGTNRKL